MVGIHDFKSGSARDGAGSCADGWRRCCFCVALAAPSARGAGRSRRRPAPGLRPTRRRRPPAWNLHFQSTVGAQGHPSFPAEYTGPNSLNAGAEVKDTISVDVMGGVRLWRGGEFFGDVVIWQGYGLSNTLGMAGFPNGEAFRIGRTYPDAYLCRAYIRETIGLGGEKEATDDADDWAAQRTFGT